MATFSLCFVLLTTCTFETEDIIEHIGIVTITDHANTHDHCSVDFFHHNESFTENDDMTNERYTFTANDAYFFLSWTHVNEMGHSQIVGNIYNVQNPYLRVSGDTNNSFLGITPFDGNADRDGDNRNYHYVSTSDFRSKPDDIIFSFYNENNVEIHVFGSTKSHFYDDGRFLWSPKIPIIGKSHNASNYNIIHQDIECIESENEAFIVFVYEEKYIVSGTEVQYTNIYKSTFNNKYVVSHDRTPVNSIKGVVSTPLVIHSLKSNRIIICYIANYKAIRCKLYLISTDLSLVPFGDESVAVSVQLGYSIKYYNLIPLSVAVGGYTVMYSTNNQIYIAFINENGDKYFENDIFIAHESVNPLAHGQIIELSDDDDDACCVYILMSFVSFATDQLMAVVYYIDFSFDPPHFAQVGDVVELHSFPNNEEFDMSPNYECISYDHKSNMLVIAWLDNYHQFAYKPFRIKLPNLNYTHPEITTIPPSQTQTETETETETQTQNVSDASAVELESGVSDDVKIIVIVLCLAAFYCSLIGVITFAIIYLVRTGKLPFAIGYKQIHKQNNKTSTQDQKEDEDESEEDFELQFADDEQTVDDGVGY